MIEAKAIPLPSDKASHTPGPTFGGVPLTIVNRGSSWQWHVHHDARQHEGSTVVVELVAGAWRVTQARRRRWAMIDPRV
jgi:hypothetical protein